MNGFFDDFKFLYFSFNRGIIAPAIQSKLIPYLDLTYVIDGELRYLYGGEVTPIKAGDAILLPPGANRRRYECTAPVSYASFNVEIPRGFTPSVEGRVENVVRSNTVFMLESVRKDFRSVGTCKNEKCLSAFLYLYHQLKETAQDKENPHVKRIKRFISDRLAEPLTLEEIAAEVHLVPRYVCTLFKEHAGMTLTDYIAIERIELAKRLIITRDMPLFKIAEECGFYDYNYFSRVFKKLTGISAKEYRKGANEL